MADDVFRRLVHKENPFDILLVPRALFDYESTLVSSVLEPAPSETPYALVVNYWRDAGQRLCGSPGLERVRAGGAGDARRVDRLGAEATLAEVYALAEQALAWVAETQLVWLVADRCMHAAQQADQPLALAGASWVLGNVYRVTGREDEALALVAEAAGLLEPRLNEDGADETRGMWGALQLHAAVTHAGLGREGDALHSWDQGADMAGRLPTGYAHPWTVFGRPNVDVHAVSVHAYLRKGGRAIDEAERVDPDTVPSLERRSRLWLEVARSYHQRKDTLAALTLLRRACDVSQEAMSCHPLARGIAGELVASGGRLVERDARALARSLGLTA
jgi:hypothetical protein